MKIVFSFKNETFTLRNIPAIWYLSCYNLELNDYIKVLDQHLEDKQKKELCGVVSLKKRNTEAPSTQPKPSNSPAWAVSGRAIHYYSIFVTVIVCAGNSSVDRTIG